MDKAKQKRLMLAVAAGAVLALVVLLTRRGDAGGAVDATAIPADTAAPGAGPSTFADNGAGFGQLSTAITDSLGQVTAGQGQVSSDIGGLQGSVDALPGSIAAAVVDELRDPGVPAAAPGPLGTAGQAAATPVKPSTDRYGRSVKERQQISQERRAGKRDKHGRTPTERRIAERSPAYNKLLHKRERTASAKRKDKKPKPAQRERSSPSQRRAGDPPVHRQPHRKRKH